ncbi:MAG: hypothetical protein IJZ94_06070 [Clostridia bacterium]|nr:hypothetical protein [Clostridia bacterium]
MKKLVLLLCVLFLIASNGCSKTEENYLSETNTGVNEMLNNVAKIRITDVAENMYKEPLDIFLTEEEVVSFVSAAKVANARQDSFSGYLYYSLEMIGVNGDVIDRLTLDTNNIAEFQSGIILERSGELDSVLKTIETKYNITTEIWLRQPDEGYFSLFNMADHGTLDEITENNFIEGIDYDFSKEECQKIENALNEFEFSEFSSDNTNMKYELDIYSSGGAGLYQLYINENNEVFTDTGYQVKSNLLSEYIGQMISKAEEHLR